MNEDNRRQLWKVIQVAGDYLEGQLPEHPNHPKGRNSYAHVALCVREKFNASYKNINMDIAEKLIFTEYKQYIQKNN